MSDSVKLSTHATSMMTAACSTLSQLADALASARLPRSTIQKPSLAAVGSDTANALAAAGQNNDGATERSFSSGGGTLANSQATIFRCARCRHGNRCGPDECGSGDASRTSTKPDSRMAASRHKISTAGVTAAMVTAATAPAPAASDATDMRTVASVAHRIAARLRRQRRGRQDPSSSGAHNHSGNSNAMASGGGSTRGFVAMLPRHHGVNEALLLAPLEPLRKRTNAGMNSKDRDDSNPPLMLIDVVCEALEGALFQPVQLTLHGSSAGGTYMVRSDTERRSSSARNTPKSKLPAVTAANMAGDSNGRIVAIFKPREEEIGQDCNPHGNTGSDRTEAFVPGTGSRREVLAYRLDHGGLAGVPPTLEVATVYVPALRRADRPSSAFLRGAATAGAVATAAGDMAASACGDNCDCYEEERDVGDEETRPCAVADKDPCASAPSRIGSLQLFEPGCVEAADVLPGTFDTDEVHALAIFDIRTLNGDRHGGNVLVQSRPTFVEAATSEAPAAIAAGTDARGSTGATRVPHLVPIDHSYICPSGYAEPEYEWLYWPQSKQPFSKRSISYIRALDAEADAALVRTALLVRSLTYHGKTDDCAAAGMAANAKTSSSPRRSSATTTADLGEGKKAGTVHNGSGSSSSNTGTLAAVPATSSDDSDAETDAVVFNATTTATTATVAAARSTGTGAAGTAANARRWHSISSLRAPCATDAEGRSDADTSVDDDELDEVYVVASPILPQRPNGPDGISMTTFPAQYCETDADPSEAAGGAAEADVDADVAVTAAETVGVSHFELAAGAICGVGRLRRTPPPSRSRSSEGSGSDDMEMKSSESLAGTDDESKFTAAQPAATHTHAEVSPQGDSKAECQPPVHMTSARRLSFDEEAAESAADVIRCTTRLLQIASLEYGFTARDIGELCRRTTLTSPSFLEETMEEARSFTTWRVELPAFEAEVRRRLNAQDTVSAAAKAEEERRVLRW